MKHTVKEDDLKIVADAQILMKVDVDQNVKEIDILKRKVDDHHRKILKLNEFPTPEEFALVRNRVDGCENDGQKIRKTVADLDKKLKQLKLSQKGGADEEQLQSCFNEIETLRRDFENFKNHTDHDLRALTNDIVPYKADKSELADLEKSLIEKIQANNDILVGTFANKDETTRRFSQLSKKIRELVELVSKVGDGE